MSLKENILVLILISKSAYLFAAAHQKLIDRQFDALKSAILIPSNTTEIESIIKSCSSPAKLVLKFQKGFYVSDPINRDFLNTEIRAIREAYREFKPSCSNIKVIVPRWDDGTYQILESLLK